MMTTTNDILRDALYAGAKATDEIAPGQGKHMRKFADELYPESSGFTLPLTTKRTAVYDTIYDAEDRLVAFIGMSDQSAEWIKRIANAVNSHDLLYEALCRAKETIRAFNGLGMTGEVEQACWDAYQHSPEMKQINAALAAVESQEA